MTGDALANRLTADTDPQQGPGEIYVVVHRLQLTMLLRQVPPDTADVVVCDGEPLDPGRAGVLPHELGATVIQALDVPVEGGRTGGIAITVHNVPRGVLEWVAVRDGRRFLLDAWTRDTPTGVMARWTGWVFTPDRVDADEVIHQVGALPGRLTQDVHGRYCTVRFNDYPGRLTVPPS